ADDGGSAQTAEHVAVLDALGVRHALLAVTKADLADPAPVTADVRERLTATSMGEGPAVAVSALTGAGGRGQRPAGGGSPRGGGPPRAAPGRAAGGRCGRAGAPLDRPGLHDPW